MTSTAPTSHANARTLLSDALDHSIFAMVAQADLKANGPVIIESAEGITLTDVNGHSVLDMMSSAARANTLGYGNAEIAQAMYDQALAMHYIGTVAFTSPPAIQLAKSIAELAPGRLSKTMFTSGGSEATEAAMKLAKQYQAGSGNKPNAYKIISRWSAFHGSTMGSISATDWLPIRETIDPRVPGYSFVANPQCYRNAYGMGEDEYIDVCLKHLERQIQLENPELVAAFIGEPIMQANGAQVPPKAYWQGVREICDKYGVVMIVDEIITGFGRAGYWFVSEYFEIEPDIITSAKALTAGYAPMGAVIAKPEIADSMAMFRHVHTFSGHAISAAVANKVIEIKTRDNLIETGRENGVFLQDALRAELEGSAIVGDIRGLGLWQAVDFTADRSTRAAFTDDTVKAVSRRMWDMGIMANAIGTSIEMAPPLVASRADLAEAARVMGVAVKEVSKERGL